MDKVGAILPKVLARQPAAARLAEMRLEAVLRSLLGETLSAACEEVALHGRALHVTTRNPALAHQLRQDAGVLLERVNRAAQVNRRVRELRVRTAPPHRP